jgi:hypothetical protein
MRHRIVIVIAIALVVSLTAACDVGTTPTMSPLPTDSALLVPTPAGSASIDALSPAPSGLLLTSPRARDHCVGVADGFGEDLPDPLVVVGAIDTDVAGLDRATVSAVTFDPGAGDASSHWPGLDPGTPATLCFLDGRFDEASQALGVRVDRIVVGYVEDVVNGSTSSAVIDFGARQQIRVVAP